MIKKRIDISGKKFNRLLVVKYHSNDKSGNALWECLCDCGKIKIGCGQSLRNGALKSCGCSTTFDKSEGHKKHGHLLNYGRTPEYTAWNNMIQRCTNPNREEYDDYGGRGIMVCDRWLKFENFIEDVGRRPSNLHSIDRFPDNDGNYEPENFRWAIPPEQNRNTRRNRWVEYNGDKMIVKDWADKYGVCQKRLGDLLKIKSFEDAISFLLNPNRKIGKGSGRTRKFGIYSHGVLIKEYMKFKEVIEDNHTPQNVRYYLKYPMVRNGFEWKYIEEKAA